ncbi:DinB family protein [Spirilliplanes yamanashiensis]|uniref:DinB family protein n=1 Tax=Spirilliplanes yamanashiensis TaxID=42233 RepID=A0A8J3YDX8_9ACTN|nr:DinB family protein [Spirilliplanes yamanashiensis]MDP9816438.1 hypothetical protein [Spirilliplanes yamanashiensis]GIJ05965.1 hypothetical protein Sya03_53170 [Spirilliplanes yamanashiensis]
MRDDVVKGHLLDELRFARGALVWKLDGLSEYDVRRPLTSTGTNLLGLVKHVATWEARYLGEVFGRPFPGPLPRWQDADGSDLWVTPGETREQVLDLHRRAAAHAEATVGELPLDARGRVPWWPRPDVDLFAVVVHVLADTTRHAGHADILREQLDGRTGEAAAYERPVDAAEREARWAAIEAAARAAS